MSFYRQIPEYIIHDEILNDGEKLFYGLITRLMEKYGFCFATNEFLAEESKKNSRQVQRYLKKLKENGYIIIELIDKFERRIWTPETWAIKDKLLKVFGQEKFNQKFTRYDMDVVGVRHGCRGGYDMDVTHNNITNTNKEKNTLKSVQKKVRIDDAPPTPPKKVFHRPNVSTTEEEHTKLIASHGKEFVDECYDELSLWKEDNPTKAKQKKSDYLCIIRWVIDKVREKRIKAEELAQREKRLKFYESRSFTNSSDAISQNKEQAKLWEEHFSKMSQKMPSFYVGKKVIALQDRIEIQMREGHCVDIPYSLQKESFNEKCLNYLNSMVPKNKNG